MNEKQLIDLKTLGRFRYDTEEGGRAADPYSVLLLCQHGHIYLHGPRTLGAATRSRGPIANRLAALPGVEVVQDGSDGINVVFDLATFDAVADIMRPRARRQLSDAHRVALVKAGARFRYGSSDDCREQPGPGIMRVDTGAA